MSPTTAAPRYWVDTVSLDHVQIGVAGGFTQADHGRDNQLRRLRPGDGLVFYSPRTAFRAGQPLQRFTALGVVTGDTPYQVTMATDFHPWRLAVRFLPCRQVDARPLVTQLSFVPDAQRWGLPFRRGLFQIPEPDYRTISAHMAVEEPT